MYIIVQYLKICFKEMENDLYCNGNFEEWECYKCKVKPLESKTYRSIILVNTVV